MNRLQDSTHGLAALHHCVLFTVMVANDDAHGVPVALCIVREESEDDLTPVLESFYAKIEDGVSIDQSNNNERKQSSARCRTSRW